jgi:putative N6-adenine-specific DNA methylase
LITGSDIARDAIYNAKENLSRLPSHEAVELSLKSFQDTSGFEQGIIITNPPHGIRLGNKDHVEALYKEMGNFLKKKCNGTSAFIYIGDPAMKKCIGLKPSCRIPLVNGAVEGELLRIDSYKIEFRKPRKERADSREEEGFQAKGPGEE